MNFHATRNYLTFNEKLGLVLSTVGFVRSDNSEISSSIFSVGNLEEPVDTKRLCLMKKFRVFSISSIFWQSESKVWISDPGVGSVVLNTFLTNRK